MLIKISTAFQRYLSRCFYRPPILFHSLFEKHRIIEQFYPLMLEQMRKQFTNKLNPFNLLCPRTLFFWFLIPPYSAIGLAIYSLNEVVVTWRQQIEPNETVFVVFKIMEFKPPFPLTFLVMFAALGLVITDASYRISETIRTLYEEQLKKIEERTEGFSGSVVNSEPELRKTIAEETNQILAKSLDPFILAPRMSIYFPLYDNHTSIGFLTIDFRHVELSIKQSLEPNETVISLIRFLDLYTPFPLQVAVMLLSVGLFITGKVYEFEQGARE